MRVSTPGRLGLTAISSAIFIDGVGRSRSAGRTIRKGLEADGEAYVLVDEAGTVALGLGREILCMGILCETQESGYDAATLSKSFQTILFVYSVQI